ncbi:MAG: AMP-binding protein [Congregibacter sp.]
MSDWKTAPYRPNELPEMDLRVATADDGTVLLQHGMTLADFEPWILSHITQQAATQGDKLAYAQREEGGAVAGAAWRGCTYAELESRVRGVAGWFQSEGAEGKVVLLLTGNSVEHATLRLGAIAAGVIVCPVSAGYVATGGDFSRLRYVMELVKPAYLFAQSSASIAAAMDCFDFGKQSLILGNAAQDGSPLNAVTLDALIEHEPLTDHRSIDPEAPAAYMLTSGSTGRPKAVPQSQRMLLSNLYQAGQILGRAAGWSDKMLDWLPWSHVSGAFNLYAAAIFGGTLHIDDGKPVAGLFEETIANLREVPLRYFCNVPLGYGMLVDALRHDEELRRVFFQDLRLMLYGGAGLPQPVMDALQSMAVETCGHRIMMTTGYGLTESASGCTAIYFPTDLVGIGLPMPGLQTKLVPLEDDRFEIRLRGPNVMQGYLNNPEANAEAFDEEGFFRTGDAARFHNRDIPEEGLAYAGRLNEEFKLSSGTWVRSGSVRAALLGALTPAVSDVLLCGLNEGYLAALLVPNVAGLRELTGDADTDIGKLLASSAVRELLADRLAAHNREHPGNSTAVRRVAFMQRAPDPQRHEISDKGTINQRIAAENRKDEIAALYGETAPPHVIEA